MGILFRSSLTAEPLLSLSFVLAALADQTDCSARPLLLSLTSDVDSTSLNVPLCSRLPARPESTLLFLPFANAQQSNSAADGLRPSLPANRRRSRYLCASTQLSWCVLGPPLRLRDGLLTVLRVRWWLFG